MDRSRAARLSIPFAVPVVLGLVIGAVIAMQPLLELARKIERATRRNPSLREEYSVPCHLGFRLRAMDHTRGLQRSLGL